MKNVVDIKYQQQRESFAHLLAQEGQLRKSLRQLDVHLAESNSREDKSRKAIGADVLWQAWVGRKKRELNMQLAQVLAMKERHVAQVRQAYGKVIVTTALCTQIKTTESKKEARSQLNRAIDSTLF